MKKMAAIISFVMSLGLFAQANVVFSPGISYLDIQNEQTQPSASSSEQNETRADFRLGYVLPMGLYLGAMYAHISQDTNGSDASGNLIGPTVGYYSYMGFYTLFTYHISGELGDAAKYSGAKGPQLDVGWVFPLSAYFSIGPQITYRSIEFDSLEAGGTSQDSDLKQTTIAPYLSLWFMF